MDQGVFHERIIVEMLLHPVLVNRPNVCTQKGVRLCRPSEAVLELLDRSPFRPLCNEDGTSLIDADGRWL
ncbi:hypothetical protein [Aestuariivirga litoralis]|uniref:hypothetical protein n=1 Tax=Aestuariivirga litoralis TaxID=2650924 RepID=UPI0032B1757B